MDELKKDHIEEFNVTIFNAVEIGKSLKEVAVDLIETDKEQIMSRWYHSESDVDVYVWLDQRQNIIKQQVNLCGQLVEWNILDGIRTGFVVEEESEQEELKETIQFDKAPVKSAVKQALIVVNNAMQVPELDRILILENFTHGRTIKDIDSQEFAAKFGESEPPKLKEGLWDRFKKWVAA